MVEFHKHTYDCRIEIISYVLETKGAQVQTQFQEISNHRITSQFKISIVSYRNKVKSIKAKAHCLVVTLEYH